MTEIRITTNNEPWSSDLACDTLRFMSYTPFLDQKALLKLQQRTSQSELPGDHVSHEIIDRLLTRLDMIRIQPQRILLLGWQMDSASKKLKKRYPSAKITVLPDLSSINPLENNAFDLVISHCALLREREPLQLLREIYRVLREEGLLLLTSLGPDTLYELNNSFLQADQFFHVHPFTDMHDVGDWMRSLHFADPVMDREEITMAYDDLYLLFQDLKIAGSTNVHEARQRGLVTPRKWRIMLQEYEKFKIDDYYPATLEVIYGHGWKVKLVQKDSASSGEVLVSVDSIKKK